MINNYSKTYIFLFLTIVLGVSVNCLKLKELEVTSKTSTLLIGSNYVARVINIFSLKSSTYFIMIRFHIYLHWISVDIEKSANPSLYPLFWMASPIPHFWVEENHPSMHGIGNQNDIHFSNNFFWKKDSCILLCMYHWTWNSAVKKLYTT